MPETHFEQILKQVAGPRLLQLGYEYDTRLWDRDISFGFSKWLDTEIVAIIEFQRHQYEEVAWGWAFRVNLIRSMTQNPAEWYPPHREYKGYLNTLLSGLLWAGYGLRIFPHFHHWWEAADAEQFEKRLLDALDLIERYGIPWLEDPQSRMSTEGYFGPSLGQRQDDE
jgi:hypothetical protein